MSNAPDLAVEVDVDDAPLEALLDIMLKVWSLTEAPVPVLRRAGHHKDVSAEAHHEHVVVLLDDRLLHQHLRIQLFDGTRGRVIATGH